MKRPSSLPCRCRFQPASAFAEPAFTRLRLPTLAAAELYSASTCTIAPAKVVLADWLIVSVAAGIVLPGAFAIVEAPAPVDARLESVMLLP